MAVELAATLSEPLHRVNSPLNWDVAQAAAVDGALELRTMNDVPTLFVVPVHPRVGVSLFQATCSDSVLEKAQAKLGVPFYSCVVSEVHKQLPASLGLVNDRALRLKLAGTDKKTTTIGQHYSLFVKDAMPVAEFERQYEQLLAQSFSPCAIAAAGDSPSEGEPSLNSLADKYSGPYDPVSWNAVQALEELARQTSNPNTKFFATLFALDMRATNPSFSDVLSCGNMAAMIAQAFNFYTVRDPYAIAHVEDAQDMLACTLKHYSPQPVKYQELLTAHPMRFLDGRFDMHVYDEQVRLAAPTFVNDKDLRQMVKQLALPLLKELQEGAAGVDVREVRFEHQGVRFSIVCALDKARK